MAKYQSIYGPIGDDARIIWSFFSILVVILIFVVGGVAGAGALVAAAMASIGSADMSAVHDQLKAISADSANPLQLLPFLTFILVTFAWVWVVENRSLATIGFTAKAWASRYLRGFLSGAAFLLVVVGAIYALGGYRIEAMAPLASAADPVGALGLIALFLVGFLIQGAGEEVIFRGWWMSALAARRGKAVALAVTAIFFALAHMGNIWPPTFESLVGVANVFLFGLFIGLYALKEGSLWGVCGWHSAWNWLLGLGFGLEVSGQGMDATPLIVDLADKDGAALLLTGGGFGPEASMVTTAVLLLGCVWFLARGALRKE